MHTNLYRTAELWQEGWSRKTGKCTHICTHPVNRNVYRHLDRKLHKWNEQIFSQRWSVLQKRSDSMFACWRIQNCLWCCSLQLSMVYYITLAGSCCGETRHVIRKGPWRSRRLCVICPAGVCCWTVWTWRCCCCVSRLGWIEDCCLLCMESQNRITEKIEKWWVLSVFGQSMGTFHEINCVLIYGGQLWQHCLVLVQPVLPLTSLRKVTAIIPKLFLSRDTMPGRFVWTMKSKESDLHSNSLTQSIAAQQQEFVHFQTSEKQQLPVETEVLKTLLFSG